ncbi:enoyl-(acyl carrier) reductase (macronuclear) [Tetrahymena thermophila SB210]|uniref:Enoyl-(Acyl carrier) reductase n=1 Tax=Tetrahymena thermophila (strain SB210) TaxID=312017 RepID=Q22RY4_TETTS|nr:enoyl-(acyl carrier) reductase [Tetrahymena thermophila SB210]EAR87988.2 enoyl-(acyl carrier) reductase [Tetrahymena thermophila SB210]|eukprot:XP_001008233.2 enoyl-(acyl carrier) reductase [Tetrahymena thermophila SB210]
MTTTYPRRFENKVAIVTASSTGIGLDISKRLALEGATVIINSRSQKNVTEAVEMIRQLGGKAEGLVCHAGKPEDRQKLLQFAKDKFGGVDILIPNAAVSTFMGAFTDTPEQAMDKMYEINFKGVLFLVRDALPFMRGRKGANVILVSSLSGYEQENLIGFYGITKTMVLVMNKLLARELQSDGIRVNCVAPGVIKTKFSEALWKDREQQTILSEGVSRLGVPEDVSSAVAYLASEEASFITGECLAMAGKPLVRL